MDILLRGSKFQISHRNLMLIARTNEPSVLWENLAVCIAVHETGTLQPFTKQSWRDSTGDEEDAVDELTTLWLRQPDLATGLKAWGSGTVASDLSQVNLATNGNGFTERGSAGPEKLGWPRPFQILDYWMGRIFSCRFYGGVMEELR